MGAPGTRVFVEDLPPARRALARLGRTVSWARSQGVGRVLEEKEIDPLRTVPAAARRLAWRVRHGGRRGGAVPVFLVGLQRSGTNMLVRGLAMSPEVEVHGENDRKAFTRFQLRPDPVIREIVESSPYRLVLFKPLCDSDRVDHLLGDLGTTQAGRAIWAYRDVDGRVRSALAKFGDGNRAVLAEFAAGTNTTRWHVRRISGQNAAIVRSFDYATMTAETGAALMWYVRNSLYFDLGLDRRDDVLLSCYNDLLADPEGQVRSLAAFLGFPYRPDLSAHIQPRPPTYVAPLDIDPLVRALCDDLGDRLAAAAASAGAHSG